MTKEHLEGRASAIEDVTKLLDILIEESRYTWLLKRLRQELEQVRIATEETAKSAPSVYDQSRAYDDGWNEGYAKCALDYEIELVEP